MRNGLLINHFQNQNYKKKLCTPGREIGCSVRIIDLSITVLRKFKDMLLLEILKDSVKVIIFSF